MKNKLGRNCIRYYAAFSLLLMMQFNVFSEESPDRFFWPLAKESSTVLLRPGLCVNPVYENSLTNLDYFISGVQGEPVYAPESGVVDWGNEYGILFPSGYESYSFSTPDEVRKAFERHKNPIFSETNATKDLVLHMADGRRLYIYGLAERSVEKGTALQRGQQIGTLGYIPTFSKDPCLSLSLVTKNGQTDEALGMLLLGENDQEFFASLKTRKALYNPDNMLTVEQARDAWKTLSTAILEDHPALCDKELIEPVSASLLEGEKKITGPITAGALRTLMQTTCAKLNCSHTKIKPFDTSWQTGFFPVELVLHEDRCYVVFDKRKNQELPVGTEIFAINGISVQDWIQRLQPLVNCDSRTESVRREYLERNFVSMLETYMIPTTKIAVTYSGKNSSRTELSIPVLTTAQRAEVSWPSWMLSNQGTLTMEKDNTAILKIWSIDQATNKKEIIEYFKRISESNVKNLIIDLRGNQGGTTENTAFLYSFFAKRDFLESESLEIRHAGPCISFRNSTNYTYFEKDPYPMVYSDYQNLINGQYKVVNQELQKQSVKYVFSGNVFVLVDVFTVSAAVNFARMLVENNDAIVVGTETSGGYYSCNANKDNFVLLGDSGLTLRLPLFRIVFTSDTSSGTPKNSGLIPQYIVPKTLNDELYGTDSQMEYVNKLFR